MSKTRRTVDEDDEPVYQYPNGWPGATQREAELLDDPYEEEDDEDEEFLEEEEEDEGSEEG